jgi:uncharacterized damage-inducible protein DinB
MSDLRFPTGKFSFDPDITPDKRRECIARIAAAPTALRNAVSGLDEHQLDTPYRPDGWTVRQVVHHLADSHVNAFIRFKLALTEHNPTIKPYDEAAWALLADMRAAADVSLALVDGVHLRWVLVLESMTDQDFARPLQHPEMGPLTLDRMLQLYAWHGGHHIAHVTALRQREGW